MAKYFLAFFFFGFCSFALHSQAHNYVLAQKIATRFMGAQRCGATQSWMHGACHTQDGSIVSKDLSGGWHDCGDYIKFHGVEAYAAVTCLVGYDFYPEVYADDYTQANSAPPSNGIPDILDEVKIETDYLIKTISSGTVYWQVGDGFDHDDMSEPVTNSNLKLYAGSTARTVLSANSAISNICGNAAAALALMSIAYKPYDAGYSATCLQKAIEYYTAGKVSANFKTDPDNFYPMANYEDDMALAGTALYRATNTSTYLTDVTKAVTGYINLNKYKNNSDPNYWGNVKWLNEMELYKATGTAGYLTNVYNHLNSLNLGACGLYFYDGSGSLEYSASEAFLAALYHSVDPNAAVYSFAKTSVDAMLGSHSSMTGAPANYSFLIGYNQLGGGFPLHPQHGPAWGQSNAANIWTLYSSETATPGSVPFKHECTGALVGGPKAQCNSYVDNIDDSDANEVCVGYNAQFIGALAYINKVENNIGTENTVLKARTVFSALSNPVYDQLLLQSSARDQYTVFDAMGTALAKGEVLGTKVVDFTGFSSGLYFIVNSDGAAVLKIVKQ